jgi:hypothetical protein
MCVCMCVCVCVCVCVYVCVIYSCCSSARVGGPLSGCGLHHTVPDADKWSWWNKTVSMSYYYDVGYFAIFGLLQLT